MMKFSTLTLASALLMTGTVAAAELTLSQYNAGENAIFPTTSVLVSGEKESILFDAQFSIIDAQALVKQIKQSNKKLTMIYVSSGDPDYYFGLQPLIKAFPDAQVVASQAVVDHINHTKQAKLQYWGPILGDAAPTNLIVPAVLNATTLYLEGEKIEVKEINTHQAHLWIPSSKTVFGGVSITSGMHVWTADTQTKESRTEWTQSLERMKILQPATVIPGHYLGEMPQKMEAVQFTIDYLAKTEQALESATDKKSDHVIKMMTMHYPALKGVADLELSAKVITGEMQW